MKPRFFTPARCAKLRALYDRFCQISSQKDYTFNKVLHLFDLEKRGFKKEAAFMEEAVRLAHQRVVKWADPGNPIYVEAAFLAMLPQGGRHPRHCDNCKDDGSPNHTPNRDYSSLVYLNGDFKGAPIIFPGRGEVQPKTGVLVAFPSTHEYPHEVPPVLDGRRYSMPVWFTMDPKHDMFRGRK